MSAHLRFTDSQLANYQKRFNAPNEVKLNTSRDVRPITGSEDEEQIALFQWLATQRHGGLPLSEIAFHVPNGGSRHKAEAAKLKAMGVQAGIPDVWLPIASGEYHALCVELKASAGVISTEQQLVHAKLISLGIKVCVCWGWVQASEAITEYLRDAA